MGCASLLKLSVRAGPLAATPARGAATGMSQEPLLLALHSSTERFGVALLDPQRHSGDPSCAVFDDGRGLSNSLFTRVEALLPAERWPALQGLAVATGPGGFTGTRLSVVLARTLAQQLGCPLLGVSSYSLMAARLAQQLPDPSEPFWIQRQLPRRGLVAGCYRVLEGRVNELEPPHLIEPGRVLAGPALDAQEEVEADVVGLLELLRVAVERGASCPWQTVLPIYPTSPVGTV